MMRPHRLLFPVLAALLPLALSASVSHAHEIKEIHRFPIGEIRVPSADVSPDGKTILVCGYREGGSFLAHYDLGSGALLQQFEGGQNEGQDVDFSPDGKLAATCGPRTIVVRDLETGAEIHRIDAHLDADAFTPYVRSVAFSPDGKFLMSGGNDRALRLWDLRTGEEVRHYEGHFGAPSRIEFSPDGRKVLSGGKGGVIHLWDVEAGNEIKSFQTYLGDVDAIAFLPDTCHALTGQLKGPVILWDLERLREVRRWEWGGNPWFTGELRCARSLSPSSSGDRALFGLANGDLLLWNISEWKEIARVEAYTPELHGTSDVLAFLLPEGKSAVTLSKSRKSPSEVIVWSLPDVEIEPAPFQPAGLPPEVDLQADDEVRFPDPNLDRVVRSSIGAGPGPIRMEDLAGLTVLSATDEGIFSLSGLQHCRSLRSLHLASNKIKDISPLAGLRDLEELDLSRNLIEEILPLGDLQNLQHLDLSTNSITHLSPISELNRLTFLNLSDNFIQDIGPLYGLRELNVLLLDHNDIKEVDILTAILDPGDRVSIESNPISRTARYLRLSGLESSGVEVKK